MRGTTTCCTGSRWIESNFACSDVMPFLARSPATELLRYLGSFVACIFGCACGSRLLAFGQVFWRVNWGLTCPLPQFRAIKGIHEMHVCGIECVLGIPSWTYSSGCSIFSLIIAIATACLHGTISYKIKFYSSSPL